MKSQEQINQELSKKKLIITNAKKEASLLHKFIRDNEEILSVLDSVDLCVLTNERLIILYKDWIKGVEIQEFKILDITSVEVIGGIFTCTLKITVAGNSKEIIVTKKDIALNFKNDITNYQSKLRNKSNQPQIDVASQLEKLADLKSKGILTEGEFQQQKTKLLNL